LKSMPKHKDIDVIVTSPPYMSQASENPNVHKYRKGGKFAEEKVDAIITSPPFRTGSQGGGLNQKPPKTFRGVLKKHTFKLSDDPKNVDNLQYGSVDAIVTSPPYADRTIEKKFKTEKELEEFAKQQWTYKHGRSLEAVKNFIRKSWQGYPETADNIANLGYEESEQSAETSDFDDEWSFPNVSTKLQRPWYVEESISHPAKMNVLLARKIIKQFTKPGDTVLDPMTGCGTVNVEAMLLGRNTIAVELEQKFIDRMVEPNIRKVKETNSKSHFPLRLGETKIICGDARRLSELLSGPIDPDAIVTSPPFSDSFRSNPKVNVERRLNKLKQVERDSVKKGQKWAMSSDRILKRRLAQQDLGYGIDPGNIGNLPHGAIDAIVTSPPYEGSYLGGGDAKKRRERLVEAAYDPKEFFGGKARNAMLRHYDKVDAIVTSPPYEGSLEGTTRHTKGGIPSRDWSLGQTGTYAELGEGKPLSNKENIGSLKNETYLQAMHKCYHEFFKVLKPNGSLVLVLKNFIRGHQVVDLVSDTIKLCKSVGFRLENRIKHKLNTASFWRVNYAKQWEKKFGRPFPRETFASVYDYETVLVFRK